MMYTDCDIPAKLFYNEVIGKANLSVLGQPTEKEQQEALMNIIDELCEIEDNKEMLAVYRKREKVSRIQSVITTIEAILFNLAYSPVTNEEKSPVIEALNSIEYVKIKFDIKKGLLNEVERVQTRILGMLRNQIKSEMSDIEKKDEKIQQKAHSFEKEKAHLEQILPSGRVDDGCTLRLYAEYKNIAKELTKQRQKNGK